MIKIGRRGSLTGKIEISGIQGHVAYPHLSNNPINTLISICKKLKDKKLDKGNKNFQPSNLEFTAINVDNKAHNVIPSRVNAQFNVRYNNFHTAKSLKKKINFLSSSADFKVVLPKKNWHDKFEQYWSPTEENALNIIKKFIDSDLSSYGSARNIPGIKGTSKISPYLAFGQIHVETIWEKCLKTKKKENGYRRYINELGWREFSHSLINYFPNMLKGNLRKEFDNFPWEKNKKNLQAWKKGITGYPIVDAGMRELNETGWMHNRVRMITASFLVKHLRIHWQEGEKHFRNCLLDFNAANNVAGWQWVAGCGADAAPYFRIFNPILQGEKFDPEGKYIKKWIPELKNVSEKFIHKPWEIKEEIRGLDLGADYPLPIVDHPKARMAALKAFQKIKK